jgi:hypothetical protein
VIEYIVIIGTCSVHVLSRYYVMLVLIDSWLENHFRDKMKRNTKAALGFEYYQISQPHRYEVLNVMFRVPL